MRVCDSFEIRFLGLLPLHKMQQLAFVDSLHSQPTANTKTK